MFTSVVTIPIQTNITTEGNKYKKHIINVNGELRVENLSDHHSIRYRGKLTFIAKKSIGMCIHSVDSIRVAKDFIISIDEFLRLDPKSTNSYDFNVYEITQDSVVDWKINDTLLRMGMREYYQSNPSNLNHISVYAHPRERIIVRDFQNQLYKKYCNKEHFEKTAEVAVNFWVSKIRKLNATEQAIKIFENRLKNLIVAEFQDMHNNRQTPHVILEVDYNPNCLLSEASEGLNIVFPFKTILWVDLLHVYTRNQTLYKETPVFD